VGRAARAAAYRRAPGGDRLGAAGRRIRAPARGEPAHSVCVFLGQLEPPGLGGRGPVPAHARLSAARNREAARARRASWAIGRRDRLPQALVEEIERAERRTAEGKRLYLRLAVDYSSRDAISLAAARLDGASHSPEELRRLVSETLTRDAGEVDLLIRTGGEKRLSDFLLWESAYAELVFTDRMWPDFEAADLEAALGDFRRRERRFGGLPAAVSSAGTGGRP